MNRKKVKNTIKMRGNNNKNEIKKRKPKNGGQKKS